MRRDTRTVTSGGQTPRHVDKEMQMSFRSNITNVRINEAGTVLFVGGESENPGDVLGIHVALAAAPDASFVELALPGSELVPTTAQIAGAIEGSEVSQATSQWTVEIDVPAARFAPADQVVLAGTALRSGGSEPDVWISSSRILSENQQKPAAQPSP
jgi:hypothetical protein